MSGETTMTGATDQKATDHTAAPQAHQIEREATVNAAGSDEVALHPFAEVICCSGPK